MKFISLFFLITFFAGGLFAQTEFIENKGQWDKQVKFMSYAGNGAFFLRANGFTVLQHNKDDVERIVHKHHLPNSVSAALDNLILRSHAYAVEFVGANEKAEIVPDKAIPSVNNYFIGNDPSKWAANCKIYGGVTYKNIYPGIDLRYYAEEGIRLKYDLIVHPGADASRIALRYKGADGLQVKNNELVIKTSVGDNTELSPYSYQVTDNQRKEVETRYEIKGDVVRFRIKGNNTGTTLIIDPQFRFFTYTGSTADNWGFTATYGPDGSFYSGGIVFGTGFPSSTGAFQVAYAGGCEPGSGRNVDMGIMKLTPDGKSRVYATYIGGKCQEQPHSLIVDPQGNLIIAGRTNSSDYPTTVTPTGGGLMDIVVTKLNAAGNALIGSMRIGGSNDDGVNITANEALGTRTLKRNYGDDARSEVIIDGAGNIYVASCSQSLDFPTTVGSVQKNFGGRQDGVVIKLNPNCNAILWSTYLGGVEDDACYVLALGANNNVYVAGGTASTSIPSISTTGVISSSYAGGPCDGYVVELNNTGTTALRGTYLGTGAADQVYGISTDKNGNIYVMGTTEGSWPVINAAYSNPNSKQFIAKLDPNLNNYIYSTVFGSGSPLPNISPTAFLVDRCENVYVSGWGGKADYKLGFNNSTTKGMPVTSDAIKKTTDPSGSDFYFIVIKRDAASLLYGTFFGQDDPVGDTPETFGDHVDGGTSRFDQRGFIYQAICANCNRTVSFPGTPGTWSISNNATGGGLCNLGMLKIEMDFAGVNAGPQASINAVVNDTAGCTPLTVDFIDTVQNGKRFVWDFGDGSPQVVTTTFNISHTYNSVGNYLVTLVAIDSSTCNIADTAHLTIHAGNNRAILDFIPTKTGLCTDLSYQFTNTSSASTAPFKANSFIWDFGDGSPRITTGLNPVNHLYAGPGTYNVKLILSDTSFCNSPDSLVKTVRLSPQVKAMFTTPPQGCVPYNAAFNNTSAGGLNFVWDFGDGSTSTLDNPTHLYGSTGTYVVKLYAYDSTSCNKSDSTTFTITVVANPVAAFSFSPVPPQENTATQFTNLSLGAITYLWHFGDGDSSTEINPSHLYIATGTYDVCLTATNSAGCPDDTCMQVSAIIKPLLDVPSAFTPGKFGVNGIVSVKGFGIKEMQWVIYNRWGQKVFESSDPANGWNGMFKGKLQPMDVYTYTLEVIFSDGNKVRKTGDITLIR